MEKGIIYAATGHKYILEAQISVRSLKRWCPNMPATLFTDHGSCSEQEARSFDGVKWITRGSPKLTNISAMIHSPYEHTLFLDTDTYICDDINGMFQWLEWYDILFPFSVRRRTPYNPGNMPDWFTERSSGAVLYQRTPEIIELFKQWGRLYKKYHKASGCPSDQVPLRVALFNNKTLRVGTIAPEYHCYVLCPITLAGRVHIIHGRGDMEDFAAQVNIHDGIRTYLPRHGIIDRERFDRAMKLLQREDS